MIFHAQWHVIFEIDVRLFDVVLLGDLTMPRNIKMLILNVNLSMMFILDSV